MSDFSKIEQTIGYTFENKDLLQITDEILKNYDSID